MSIYFFLMNERIRLFLFWEHHLIYLPHFLFDHLICLPRFSVDQLSTADKRAPLELIRRISSGDVAELEFFLKNQDAKTRTELLTRNDVLPPLVAVVWLTDHLPDEKRCETAKLLLEQKADVAQKTSTGSSVLHYLGRYSKALMQLLCDALEEKDRAHTAGSLPVRAIDEKDECGNTALHKHAALGNADHCMLLLENRANIDIGDRNGKKAREIATGLAIRAFQ
jgi:ankyrin repeat protein